MKSLLLLIAVSIFLSGCNSTSTSLPSSTAYAKDQVYEGYPCGDSCDSFKQGYDRALETNIIRPADCSGETEAEVIGCKAYVADYKYDHKTYGDYAKDF